MYRTAASKVVMRSGCHFTQLAVVNGHDIFVGLIRPGWDVVGEANVYEVDGHCFYDIFDGYHFPSNLASWDGTQGANTQGDRISMLLNLDHGSMTVWKNGVKLARGAQRPFLLVGVYGRRRGASSRRRYLTIHDVTVLSW